MNAAPTHCIPCRDTELIDAALRREGELLRECRALPREDPRVAIILNDVEEYAASVELAEARRASGVCCAGSR